jgi:NNP family nitrate/nitrite transporter-like MFS transporter
MPRRHQPPRLVVVGNGMAGARVVEEIIERGGRDAFAITIFGAEPYGNYNRILLSSVLAGTEDETAIFLNGPAWYAENGVDLRAGVRVARIDRFAKRVYAEDGAATPYDKLVIATGSRPFVPNIPGGYEPRRGFPQGVFVFRTIDDTRRMVGYAREHEHAVVIGGGLLGLEAARGLQRHGVRVTLVHAAAHLMNQQLDAQAGEILRRSIRELGIEVHVGARSSAITGVHEVTGVALADGRELGCDMVVITAGVRPNTELAAAGGLTVERAIVVDDQLRSLDDPDVYAVGECAQHRGEVYGLVAPLWEQARVLADHVTGTDPHAAYHGSRTATKLKVAGVDVAAMGLKAPERADDEFLVFAEPRRGVYQSLVIRSDRLVGATLLGDVSRAASLLQAYDRGTPLPAERIRLLYDVGGADADPTELDDDAEICNCNGVTKSALLRAAAVGQSTRAGSGCGSCKPQVARIVERASSASPAAAAKRERWIDDWRPESPDFWDGGGAAIARRNLIFSIFAEHIGFSVWTLWSVLVLFLGPEYGIDPAGKFLLTALPAAIGSAVRVPYTLAVARFGGRNWTIVSAALLLLPCVLALFVLHPGVSYGTLLLVAATAGVGGGNFASSMTNINNFYPDRLKGWALGLNAGGGNIGVAAVQLVGLLVLAVAGRSHPRLVVGVYIPLIVLAAVGAALGMDNLSRARNRHRALRDALAEPQTWIMSFLYIGTFGSFIGFGFAFGQVLQVQFAAQFGTPVRAAYLTFLGPLLGSLIRPVGGALADRIGGARVTFWNFVAMAAAAGIVLLASVHGSLPAFLIGFVLLFVFSGLGNGSTYKMIPAIFRARAAALPDAEDAARRLSGAVIGIAGAIGAFGGVLVNVAFRQSFLTYHNANGAYATFIATYALCFALTWAVYLRSGTPLKGV